MAPPSQRSPAENFRLARARHGDGRLQDAEPLYRLVLAAQPDHFDALNNLGLLLERQGKNDEAIALTRRAIALNPRNPQSRANLGRMLSLSGRHEDALAQLREAFAIEPANTQTLAKVVAELRSLNRQDEAISLLEETIVRLPRDAEVQHMLGGLLHGFGRLDAARRCFEKAVALRPNGHYYRDLAIATRFAAGNPHLAAMEAMLSDPATPPGEQMALHFALAKACSDRGEFARSFHHQREANRLRRGQTSYDEPATLALIERVRRDFSADVLRAGSGLGDPSQAPVFIVGMPRSGSTLVEQILASHPDVQALGESPALEQSVVATFPTGLAAAAVENADQLRAIGAAYLAAASRLGLSAPRITDKMLPNFLYAGLIHLVFPKARIVHVMRDPIDTCLSCFAEEFPAGAPYLFELGELGRYYRAYAELMEHWREVLPPEVMLEVRYEDVVADLETEARRLVKHCGLEWNAACLSFEKSTRPVWTASAAQVRRPIYKSSVGRWRPPAEEIAPLLRGLGPYAT
jgi:tetratricopeptide (TPR) repeat protein